MRDDFSHPRLSLFKLASISVQGFFFLRKAQVSVNSDKEEFKHGVSEHDDAGLLNLLDCYQASG